MTISVTIPTYPQARDLLTNSAYGYPFSSNPRRFEPIALACLHVTDNSKSPPATAKEERDNVNNNQPGGPSAHVYRNRDGSTVYAIDHDKYAAWSNGDVKSPKTTVAAKRVLDWMSSLKANCNEAFWLEIENCGRYSPYPITVKQIDGNAVDIAREAIRRGLPINRTTVMPHSDFNTVDKSGCPVPAAETEAFLTKVIDQANVYKFILLNEVKLAAMQSEIDASRGLVMSWESYGEDVAYRADSILGLVRPS